MLERYKNMVDVAVGMVKNPKEYFSADIERATDNITK